MKMTRRLTHGEIMTGYRYVEPKKKRSLARKLLSEYHSILKAIPKAFIFGYVISIISLLGHANFNVKSKLYEWLTQFNYFVATFLLNCIILLLIISIFFIHSTFRIVSEHGIISDYLEKEAD